MTPLLLVVPGALLALGVVLVAAAFRPRHVQLSEALGLLADVAPVQESEPEASGLDRLGAWWIRRREVVAPPALERQLRLRGRSLTEHYTLKLALAGLGFAFPVVAGLAAWAATGTAPVIPLLAGALLAVIGFLVPDLLLRSASAQAGEDATESLLTYFDLVTLERLANQSGTQALHAAASLSDAPVFAAIRTALERARLQQRAPYADLKDLARELDLPALSDLADVMRLDEAGASLAGALRARVHELRDAHLSSMKTAAAEVSERMTVWMVVPSLVLGLFFLIPPLLTLIGNG